MNALMGGEKASQIPFSLMPRFIKRGILFLYFYRMFPEAIFSTN